MLCTAAQTPPSRFFASFAVRFFYREGRGTWGVWGSWVPLLLGRLSSGGNALVYEMILAVGSGPVRFNELERAMTRVTRRVLTRQLKELQQDGIVLRTAYPEVPPRVEYAVTERGWTLRPIIEALKGRGEEHVLDEQGRRVRD